MTPGEIAGWQSLLTGVDCTVAVTGEWDRLTEAATAEWQRAAGVEPTGVLDAATVKAAAKALRYLHSVRPATRATIAEGDRGPLVRHAQRRLVARGHVVTIDGVFTPALRHAVESFPVASWSQAWVDGRCCGVGDPGVMILGWLLAAGDSGQVPWWLTAGVTPVAVIVALNRGYLRLPQEYAALQALVTAATSRADAAEATLARERTQFATDVSSERAKVDALNQAMREQVVPAMVAMTAATTEATRELGRRRGTGKEIGA